MGIKLHKTINQDGSLHGWMFRCPGCELDPLDSGLHCPTNGWSFNGDLERPTFSPSILVRWKSPDGERVCHSFVRDGRIEFLSDCTHALAGKVVDLPDWERALELPSTEQGGEVAHDWPEFYESLKRDARSALDEIEAKEACTAMSQLRYAGRELIDAIVSPKGRDFSHAWKEACLFFGRFGDEPTLLAKLLRVAEAARLYVADDDEDRVQTWDAMVDAIDAALDALPPMPISSATEPSSTPEGEKR